METTLQNKTSDVTQKQSIRDGILEFEDMLRTCDEVMVGDNDVCPLKHSFSPGLYVREIFIPAGMVLTGKLHKHSHPNFLMKGKVKVFTEYEGMQVLEAPLSMISKAGTKRVIETTSDTVWVTVHLNPTNTQDLKELEKIVIADSYEEYERFIEGEKSVIKKLINFILNKLT